MQKPLDRTKQVKNSNHRRLLRCVFGKATFAVGMSFLMNSLSFGAEDSSLELKFDVFLNGKLMGWHSYTVSESSGFTDVQSKTQLEGKIFVLKRINYRHQSNERWSNGCLQKLESETKSGRKKTTIEGKLTDDGFLVNQNGLSRLLPACTRTFAYWEPNLLEAEFLLNPDTGEHLRVLFEKENVATGIKVTLKTPKEPITLTYDQSGNWLELESRVRSIVPIRYQRSLAP